MSLQIERTTDICGTLERILPAVIPWVRGSSSVFIKPNLTFPRFKEGVTTTPAVIEAVIRVLKDLGVRRICVGEGEGGYNSFRMLDTLASYGSADWERRYGVEVAVVNDWEPLPITVESQHGPYTANFPRALRDEFDGVITIPVPKVHAMTVMSGAIKNQWGLVQNVMRLRLHLALSELLHAFHREVPTIGVVIDGTYGLTRNGPMVDGIPLALGWVAAASDVWTADYALAGIMRIDPAAVPYLRFAMENGCGPQDDSDVWSDFRDERFYLQLNLWNRMARLTWGSPMLNNLVYFSSMSTFLHRVMYRFRSAPPDLAVRGRDWT